MSGVLVSLPSRGLPALPPGAEERWVPRQARRPARRPAMALLLALSAALHVAAVIATLLIGRPPAPVAPREIAVEVVPEIPKAPEPAPAAPPADKPTESRKAEAPPPKPADLPPQPAASPEDATSDLKAMRDELARLQAEQAALQAETPPVPAAAAGLGPLAASLSAIALPAEAASGEGDLVGYAAAVFSSLAKAKAIGGEMGIPGTAGVGFTVDDRGALAEVRLLASSGVAKLDAEALAVVRKAAPFPPPPPGAQRTFSANVSFVTGPGR